MVWTKDHDVLLIREILVFRPFTFKFGSRERGQAWDKIADTLNTVQQVRFSVDQRGVRERYAKLEKAYKKKMREEHQASGISPEFTELDQGLETIIEMTESAQIEISETHESKRKQLTRNKETAEEVRKRAMERLSQTKARERDGQESATKKRRTQFDRWEYLQNKERREESQNKINADFREREQAFKEKKHKDLCDLKERDLILREKELNLKMHLQKEQEQRDQHLYRSMEKIKQQQDELSKQLCELKEILASLSKSC